MESTHCVDHSAHEYKVVPGEGVLFCPKCGTSKQLQQLMLASKQPVMLTTVSDMKIPPRDATPHSRVSTPRQTSRVDVQPQTKFETPPKDGVMGFKYVPYWEDEDKHMAEWHLLTIPSDQLTKEQQTYFETKYALRTYELLMSKSAKHGQEYNAFKLFMHWLVRVDGLIPRGIRLKFIEKQDIWRVAQLALIRRNGPIWVTHVNTVLRSKHKNPAIKIARRIKKKPKRRGKRDTTPNDVLDVSDIELLKRLLKRNGMSVDLKTMTTMSGVPSSANGVGLISMLESAGGQDFDLTEKVCIVLINFNI